MITKICIKCKEEKDIGEFPKRKTSIDGYRHSCKECESKRLREYYLNNQEEIKAKRNKHYKENKEKVLECCRRWNFKNRGKRLVDMKKYREKNKEKISAQKTEWARENRDSTRSATKRWSKENPSKLRARDAKRRASKMNRTPVYANLDKIEVFYWMAQKLSKLLNTKYHVDHKIPLQGKTVSGFHHENNLQIMREEDNLKKSNKYQNEILFNPSPDWIVVTA